MYKNRYEQAYCKDKYGKTVYQSGNDPMNPNGFNRYIIKGCEVWAYNYKDAQMKYKAGLVHKQLR